jgi:hypothetical protein
MSGRRPAGSRSRATGDPPVRLLLTIRKDNFIFKLLNRRRNDRGLFTNHVNALNAEHCLKRRPDLKQLIFIQMVTANRSTWCAPRGEGVARGTTEVSGTHTETCDSLCVLTSRSDFLYWTQHRLKVATHVRFRVNQHRTSCSRHSTIICVARGRSVPRCARAIQGFVRGLLEAVFADEPSSCFCPYIGRAMRK